jgi:hypothetical protein
MKQREFGVLGSYGNAGMTILPFQLNLTKYHDCVYDHVHIANYPIHKALSGSLVREER